MRSDVFAEAERLAATLGPLPLDRRRSRVSQQAGQHPRRRAGPGTEFWQYRPLTPGEARSRIDWRRSGRSDELYVREREREEPGRLLLWADGSGSMRFRSSEDVPEKHIRAQVILTALAIAAREAEEQVRVAGRPDARTVIAIAEALTGTEHRFDDALAKPGDIAVVASDFLDRGSLDFVSRLTSRGISGVFVAIADPAEADFPFSGHVRFERSEPHDPEADVGRAELLGDTYHAAWSAHCERLTTAGETRGWQGVMHRTDHPAESVLTQIANNLQEGPHLWAD